MSTALALVLFAIFLVQMGTLIILLWLWVEVREAIACAELADRSVVVKLRAMDDRLKRRI